MLRLLSLGFLFSSLMTAASAQLIELESFAQPGAQGTVVATSTWAAGNVARLPDTIVVAGTAKDDNGWAANRLNLDLRAMKYVTIIAQRDPGNEAGALVLEFVDGALRTHPVAVSTAQFAVGVMTAVQFPIGAWPGNFDASAVAEWSLGGGTRGLVPFRMTLDQIVLSATTVMGSPTISVQPVDRLIGVGSGTTLSVTATGGQDFTYLWTLNGAATAGGTGATLSLANATPANAGDYQVEVSNGVSTTTSRKAAVVVVDLQANQTLAAGAGGYEPGAAVRVSTTLTYASVSGSVRLQVLLPTGWTFDSDAGSGADVRPVAGGVGLAEWQWSALPATSPLTFSYTLFVPSNAKGTQPLDAVVQLFQSGLAGQIAVKPVPFLVSVVAHPHTADLNGDFRITLVELTRVIELYNTRKGTVRTGAYRVDDRGEDGFSADEERSRGPAASLLTRYHAADYDRDGSLSLEELVRVIQLYNYRGLNQVRTGQYRIVPAGSDDGYDPGP